MKSLNKQFKKLFLHVKELKLTPQAAIITGSGINLFKDIKAISNQQLSVSSKIKGHQGLIKFYRINNKDIIVFCGRKHLYEGLDFHTVTANIKLAYELGVKKLIITNAAGGISKTLKAGDLMLINGFIDLMQPTEKGILSGITQQPFKINTKLTKLFSKKIKSGVYAGMRGPSYETYAEIKLLQSLGASAVGMSTVPEIICAKSLGLNYAAVSVISNAWSPTHKPNHEAVLKQVKKANEKLDKLVREIILT